MELPAPAGYSRPWRGVALGRIEGLGDGLGRPLARDRLFAPNRRIGPARRRHRQNAQLPVFALPRRRPGEEGEGRDASVIGRAPPGAVASARGGVDISNEQYSMNSEKRNEIATFRESGSVSIAVLRPLEPFSRKLIFSKTDERMRTRPLARALQCAARGSRLLLAPMISAWANGQMIRANRCRVPMTAATQDVGNRLARGVGRPRGDWENWDARRCART